MEMRIWKHNCVKVLIMGGFCITVFLLLLHFFRLILDHYSIGKRYNVIYNLIEGKKKNTVQGSWLSRPGIVRTWYKLLWHCFPLEIGKVDISRNSNASFERCSSSSSFLKWQSLVFIGRALQHGGMSLTLFFIQQNAGRVPGLI